MQKENPKASAPMPKNEEKVIKNSMKLYSYLVCLSGLATYPENTRMFRQKNLILTKIKEMIGLDPETTKLYLFYLEQNNLIEYRGDYHFDLTIMPQEYNSTKEYRAAACSNAKAVWKERNKKEKEGVYYISRPNPYTPVPEITLQRLNEDFSATELELKLYLICCAYRDNCVKMNQKYKLMRLQDFRDVLGKTLTNRNDNEIKKALIFLRGIGLIDFVEKKGVNSKGAMVVAFKITDVNYYITCNFNQQLTEEDEFIDAETLERIKEGLEKIDT